MPAYLLCHRHPPAQCRVSFAAWRGFASPLRHSVTLGSCHAGGHRVWWTVEAESDSAALALLPRWVADRTEVTHVEEISIP